MRADEPDVDNPIGIVDPHHYAIFIAGNIKYHSAVLKDACAADCTFHVRRRCPVGARDLPVLRHDRLAGFAIGGASVNESLERAECNDPHRINIP